MLKPAFILFLLPSLCIAETTDVNQLSTFFTSPPTRSQLNSMRASGKYDDENTNSRVSISREPVTVTMQGIVIRKNKTPVVFVNNENTLKTHHLSNDVTVRDHVIKKQNYKIPIRVNQQGVTLKPGQQWDQINRKVEDTFRTKSDKETTKVSEITDQNEDNGIN